MTIKEEYYQNLISHIGGEGNGYPSLLRFLFEMPFTHPESIPSDDSRAIDGLDYREAFASERNYLYFDVLGNAPCNVLEMMVALSMRIEREIMSDYSKGDRTPDWFWIMITNSGLSQLSNRYFDENLARQMVRRFEYRDYNRNGSGGGLFVINDPKRDMRTADIWYQMQWFLSEQIRNGNNY